MVEVTHEFLPTSEHVYFFLRPDQINLLWLGIFRP